MVKLIDYLLMINFLLLARIEWPIYPLSWKISGASNNLASIRPHFEKKKWWKKTFFESIRVNRFMFFRFFGTIGINRINRINRNAVELAWPKKKTDKDKTGLYYTQIDQIKLGFLISHSITFNSLITLMKHSIQIISAIIIPHWSSPELVVDDQRWMHRNIIH